MKIRCHTNPERTREELSAEQSYQMEGLHAARTTIKMISDIVKGKQYSIITLPFILYVLYNQTFSSLNMDLAEALKHTN
jgi:hypothetical protein